MGEKHLPRRQKCWHLVNHTNLTKPKITQYFFFYSNPSGLVHNHRAGCLKYTQSWTLGTHEQKLRGILPLHLEDHPCRELPARQECPVNQNCWVKLASGYHRPTSSCNKGNKKKKWKKKQIFMKQSSHGHPTINCIISSFQTGLSFSQKLTQFPLGRWHSAMKQFPSRQQVQFYGFSALF